MDNKLTVPSSVTLCDDGKYRWVYEYDMLRNSAIFFTILKVLAISALVPVLILLISGAFGNIAELLKTFLLVLIIMAVLAAIAYAITAKMYGGRYCVIFTMDEEGITHAQQEKQFEKAQLAGFITAMAGASAGKPGAVGTGILAASKSEIYSDFSAVKSIRVFRKQHLIKLDYPTSHNQIYCEEDAMEFVEEYIRERCPKAK